MTRPDLYHHSIDRSAESSQNNAAGYEKAFEKKFSEMKNVSLEEVNAARSALAYHEQANLHTMKDTVDHATWEREMLVLDMTVDTVSGVDVGGLDSDQFVNGNEDFSVFSDLNIDRTLQTDTAILFAKSIRQIAYDQGGAGKLFAQLAHLVLGKDVDVPGINDIDAMVQVLWKRLQYLGFAVYKNEQGELVPMTQEKPTIVDLIRAVMHAQGFLQTPMQGTISDFVASKVDGIIGPKTLKQLLWMKKPLDLMAPVKESVVANDIKPIVASHIASPLSSIPLVASPISSPEPFPIAEEISQEDLISRLEQSFTTEQIKEYQNNPFTFVKSQMENEPSLHSGYSNHIASMMRKIDSKDPKLFHTISDLYAQSSQVVEEIIEAQLDEDAGFKKNRSFEIEKRNLTKDAVEDILQRILSDESLQQELLSGTKSMEDVIKDFLSSEEVRSEIENNVKQKSKEYKSDGTKKNRYKKQRKNTVPSSFWSKIAYFFKSFGACKRGTNL